MKRNQVSECDGCCSEDPWLVHNVYHRGIIRRFCTSCVLKLNSGSFCGVCFQVFNPCSLPKHRVLCLKCPSFAHIDCICTHADFKDSLGLYTCPPCSNPNFSFFHLPSNKRPKTTTIDLQMAKALVAASQIALASITKAATAKRLEAESRVKEAAFARKRLKDALEQFLKNSLLNPSQDNPITNENHNDTNGPPAIVHEKKKKNKVCIQSKQNHKEAIQTSIPIPSSIVQKKKKRKKKARIENKENRNQTIGTSKSGISAVIDPIRKNKKKKKKSKSISDVTAKEGLLNKLKADAERNDHKIKQSSVREGVNRVSPSKIMKWNPNNGISNLDGDKLKPQNCGIMKGNKSSNQTISQSHTVKGDKENKDSHQVHHVTKDCQHWPPIKHSVN